MARNELLIRCKYGVSHVGKFRVEPTGLIVDGEPTFEEWAAFGIWLQAFEGAIHWALGDWVNYGEEHYGEKYTQAIGAEGMDYQTLQGVCWTARAIGVL